MFPCITHVLQFPLPVITCFHASLFLRIHCEDKIYIIYILSTQITDLIAPRTKNGHAPLCTISCSSITTTILLVSRLSKFSRFCNHTSPGTEKLYVSGHLLYIAYYIYKYRIDRWHRLQLELGRYLIKVSLADAFALDGLSRVNGFHPSPGYTSAPELPLLTMSWSITTNKQFAPQLLCYPLDNHSCVNACFDHFDLLK
uniref:Uncharacterized protein n=1 Tax=Panagrolaimus sp. JU765 TaxID=591449 RepID=A0AC34QC04_9BILA